MARGARGDKAQTPVKGRPGAIRGARRTRAALRQTTGGVYLNPGSEFSLTPAAMGQTG